MTAGRRYIEGNTARWRGVALRIRWEPQFLNTGARVQPGHLQIESTDLHPADSVQGSLFLRPDRSDRVRLMACVDQLNALYRRDRVRFACSEQDRPWKLRAEYLPQRYTTRWGELLAV